MKDHNSPEEVAKRINQEDPLIMYLIVREFIDMSPGKAAAQCAHAAQMLLLKYHEFVIMDLTGEGGVALPPFSRETYELFQKWLAGSFRKVVLKADENKWKRIKETIRDRNIVLVIDAGLTELDPGTETCIGLYPLYKSTAPKIVKRLRVY